MSSAQASSSLAADAPRYGNDPLVGAYYARNTGSGAPVVSQLLAGAGVNLSPAGGQGVVTITSTAQGVSAINPGNNTGATTLGSSDTSVVITAPSAGNINFSVPSATTTQSSISNVALVTSGEQTIATISGLTAGRTYSYNFYNAIIGSATVSPGTVSPNAFLQFLIVGSSFPGLTPTAQSRTPVVDFPIAPLAAYLYTGPGTPGPATLQSQYNGQFTAFSTSVTVIARVDNNGQSGTSPQFTANSIFLGPQNYFNVTPLVLTNGP